MKVKFFGVRGSIPSPLTGEDIEKKLKYVLSTITVEDIEDDITRQNFLKRLPFHIRSTYGANTPCVLVEANNNYFILDAGSGIRVVGYMLAKDEGVINGKKSINILISHTHHDHVQGIPFFIPMYIKGANINIYGVSKNLKTRLEMLQYPQYFPVSFDMMSANINVIQLERQREIEIDGVKINNILLHHPNASYGYRLVYNGKRVCYLTDVEFYKRDKDFIKRVVDFIKGADVFIIDTQYTSLETFSKIDWGHSSAEMAIDLSYWGKVKHSVFFHHEPSYDDEKLSYNFEIAKNYLHLNYPQFEREVKIQMAFEGLEIDI